MSQPLVVTLALDDDSQKRFDTLRSRWFPRGRTEVGAHVALFHAVPGELRDTAEADLREQAGAGFGVDVTEVMSLGRGVAYRLYAHELDRRHRELARRWWPHLTAQDRQPLRAHVTVQNKVTPDQARATLHTLRDEFVPWTADALGFVLWRYDGGPWTELARIPFRAAGPPASR